MSAGHWLLGEEGYFALGFDPYFGAGEIPVWTTRGGTLADVAATATQWAQDGIEVEAKRTVRIYYVTGCRIDNEGGAPDLVISTDSQAA